MKSYSCDDQAGGCLVQNYAGPVLDRFGLGFNSVTKLNPQLIYCFSNIIVTSPKGIPHLDIYALFNIRLEDKSHI